MDQIPLPLIQDGLIALQQGGPLLAPWAALVLWLLQPVIVVWQSLVIAAAIGPMGVAFGPAIGSLLLLIMLVMVLIGLVVILIVLMLTAGGLKLLSMFVLRWKNG